MCQITYQARSKKWQAFYDIKIMTDADDKLRDDITLKNAVTLMAYIINESSRFYPQLFSGKALLER